MLTKRSDDPTKGTEHNDSQVDKAVAGQLERIDQMVVAIDQLDPEKDYTADNVPKVGSIEDIVGYQITATERDEAFAKYNG